MVFYDGVRFLRNQFIRILKFKVCLCVDFSIFDYVSFLLKFLFLFNKMHGLFDFKTS